MDKNLEQTFDISYLKIGIIANCGVIQIGCGSGARKKYTPAGYTTVGTKLMPLSAPIQFAVPLQAPKRQ